MTRISFDSLTVDDILKGVPGGAAPLPLTRIGERKWNALAEDMPLPLALLKASAIEHNSAWMRRFLGASGAVLAPHGKTTMSPQLFQRQLDDGAWGITLGNIAQIQVARRFGIQRIVLANQLVGKQAIRYVLDELRADPGFDFYCLVDSVEGVEMLATAARAAKIGRPLQVLLEGGVTGRRTGARTLDAAMAVARAVKAASPVLALRGVEGFEGIVSAPTPAEAEAKVTEFLGFIGDIARAAAREDLFAVGKVILTAGGSAYYDIVARTFAAVDLGRETLLVIRSGCYLTHDSIMYRKFMDQLLARSDAARGLGDPPKPALEVWAYVQSRPEPGRVILTMGKRDAGYDAGLPVPQSWFRPGTHRQPQPVAPGHATVEMNDQHLFMDLPAASPLQVGDMIGFGISHPCLTFDKWQFIPVVDDSYTVVSAIRTFF